MKKIFFAALAAIALAAAAFGNGDSALKAAARKFLESYAHMDYVTAREVSTAATKNQLKALEELMNMMGSGQIDKARQEARSINVFLKETDMTSDTTATISYAFSNEPDAVKSLQMVKRRGRWLAEWTKMDNMDLGDSDPEVKMPADAPNPPPAYKGPTDTNSPRR